MGENPAGADGLKCLRCGQPHTIFYCPHVKAIDFSGGYSFDQKSAPPVISRIEFLTPRDYGPPPAAPAKSEQVGYETLAGGRSDAGD